MIPINAAALSLPEAGQALKAGVAAVNKRGGLNGHPLVLDQCDTKGDPNQATACARQMVSDGVVATIGDNVSFDTINPVLRAAGIPRIGLTLLTTSDYTDPIDYAIGPGPVGYSATLAHGLIASGHKNIALVSIQYPGASAYVTLLGPGIKKEGGKITTLIQIAPGTVDYSSYIATAQSAHSDAALLLLTAAQETGFINAATQLNAGLTFGVSAGTYSLNEFKKLGNIAKSFVIGYDLPAPSSSAGAFPALNQFAKDMRASGLDPSAMRPQALNAWAALLAFTTVMKGKQTITGKTVIQAFNAAKRVNLGGLVPPWTPSTTSKTPGFTHVSQPNAYVQSFNGNAIGTQLPSINALKLLFPAP
jgi:ABC-type branched-subunit amino acid transport system substrate-binding protein